MNRPRIRAWGLCSIVVLAGCDVRPRDATGPWRIESVPADGEVGVGRASRIVVALDRRVEPRTVTRATVRLRSGGVRIPITVRAWPAADELWIDVDPATPLDPDVSYELEVLGLVDLDGVEQPEPYRIVFTTGAVLGVPAVDPPADANAAHALLVARCASAGCHGGESPAAALDLSSPLAIARTAVGVLSQLPAGTTGDEGARGALSLAGLPIIDVIGGRGQPASSYLIYKVLGDVHIHGAQMPKDRRPLRQAEIELLSAWILAGAPAP